MRSGSTNGKEGRAGVISCRFIESVLYIYCDAKIAADHRGTVCCKSNVMQSLMVMEYSEFLILQFISNLRSFRYCVLSVNIVLMI